MQSLQKAGYLVTGISAPGPDASFLASSGIRHIPIAISRRITPLRDLITLYQLFATMKREKFTIVHAHTPKPGLLAQLAARMAGVPIIVNTLHGFYFHPHMSPLLRRVYILLEKIAASCSDLILSQNKGDIETAILENICPPEKIRHLGNGIDIARFNPVHTGKRTVPGVAIRENEPVVGFVGRLVVEKGVLDLLQAARLVLQEIPSAKFLIVGRTDDEKSDSLTTEVAETWGVSDACIFTGWRDDLPELYALMDVFALPSHREGFPRTPMEASAMGVPCVVTDIRGCREVVEHGRNGLLVPLRDIRALADALIELMTDKAKARRMGEEGRRMARERFDEQLVFEKVKAEYARLLAEKGLPAPSSLKTKKIVAIPLVNSQNAQSSGRL
jgi:glycosyltransferase involved in cell wall biosynthesis